jgi:hypothetical protein
MARPRKAQSPVQTLLSTLTVAEKQYYDGRFKLLFNQADSDPVLEPTVRDIIINEIFIARYLQQLQEESIKDGKSLAIIEKLHSTISKLQDKNSASLSTLNLTKEKRDALNKSPESTPSKIIMGYVLAVSMMTPLEREKNRKDIEDAMSRLRKNQLRLMDEIHSEASGIDLEELVTN